MLGSAVSMKMRAPERRQADERDPIVLASAFDESPIGGLLPDGQSGARGAPRGDHL